MVIAIDGPSGVGKGTVSRAIAKASVRHVDTGAMYRAIAWRVSAGIDLDDEAAVFALASRPRRSRDGQVAVDGVDITGAIRTPEIDRAVTSVARMPSGGAVRRPSAGARRDGGIVMEGRDIGRWSFPMPT